MWFLPWPLPPIWLDGENESVSPLYGPAGRTVFVFPTVVEPPPPGLPTV